ncbi:MAG: VPDSG-CTERM exosortase interaction domain protein [Prevotella sp.]
MSKKSFFIGFASGIVLTLVALFVIGVIIQNYETNVPVQRLDEPVCYENKTETSFKVFQVFSNGALASEVSDEEMKMYLGNTVVVLGKNYYNDQILTVKNPQRVGTYSYTNGAGLHTTVPVIDGEISE